MLVRLTSHLPYSVKRSLFFGSWQLRRLFYWGRSNYCPVCDSHIRTFISLSEQRRRPHVCPVCLSYSRHRVVWLFFTHKTDLFTALGKRMLHFAPEQGLEVRLRRQHNLDYVTADLFRSDVTVQTDITQLDFADASFDVIYCSHVLEHVLDDHSAISEMARVLKPDGWAVILVPITANQTFEDPAVTDPAERAKVFGKPGHVRRYGLDFRDRLASGGFEVETVLASDFLAPDELERMRISPGSESTIFYCTKPRPLA